MPSRCAYKVKSTVLSIKYESIKIVIKFVKFCLMVRTLNIIISFNLQYCIFTLHVNIWTKNDRFFTQTPKYIEDNISLNFFYVERCFVQNCGENQNTNFISKDFSRKSCPLEDNVEKYGRKAIYIIRRMRFMCSITRLQTHTQNT
jgi:hypothetical protein